MHFAIGKPVKNGMLNQVYEPLIVNEYVSAYKIARKILIKAGVTMSAFHWIRVTNKNLRRALSVLPDGKPFGKRHLRKLVGAGFSWDDARHLIIIWHY